MTTTVDAVYEQGVLRLLDPTSLQDGTRVRVTIATDEDVNTVRQRPADILARIAALPVEDTRTFSGRDHDDELYGEQS